jgi:hypothetical protein
MGRQVVVFLDNIDQRDFDFQEKIFLIGQSMAETWPVTVFLSLRPDTFFRSRNKGSLTAYQPRVFTIAPPAIGKVIDKRLVFCLDLIDDESERAKVMPVALDHQATTLAKYLKVLMRSFRRQTELVEFVENLSGGNVRSALTFVNTFVGSGHVDTRKIMDIAEKSGTYAIALHEFVRAIIYGDFQHYDPSASPVANVFEISRPDGREHFLLPIVLAHIERQGEVGHEEGFVSVENVLALGQSLGFLPQQIEFALRHAVSKRLLHRSPGDSENGARRYRITTVGAYTYKKMLGTFVYLDAVVVDTPIVESDVAEQIDDCAGIDDRVKRARVFADYLARQWEPLAGHELAFSWIDGRANLEGEFDRVSRAARRAASRAI